MKQKENEKNCLFDWKHYWSIDWKGHIGGKVILGERRAGVGRVGRRPTRSPGERRARSNGNVQLRVLAARKYVRAIGMTLPASMYVHKGAPHHGKSGVCCVVCFC